MRKFEKIFDIILALVVLANIVFYWYAFRPPDSKKPLPLGEYRQCVGINTGEKQIYQWLADKFGEPEIIAVLEPDDEHNYYRINAQYGKLEIQFYATSEKNSRDTDKWYISVLTSTDPEHYFKRKIHVGSTREEVLRVYRRADDVRSSERSDSFRDGGTDDWITFAYDENDTVISVSFNATM